MITCQVDGSEVSRERIMKRVMNFGQSIPGYEPLPWAIRVESAEFLDAMEKPHAAVISELLEDEPFDYGTDEVTNRLRLAGWPSLASLIAGDKELLKAHLRKFLLDPLIDWLTLGSPACAEYQINSLDGLEITARWIEVSGECYRSRPRQSAC